MQTNMANKITMNNTNLEKTEKIRSCNHNIDENSKFCSDCGKPVWIKPSIPLLGNFKYYWNKMINFFKSYWTIVVIVILVPLAIFLYEHEKQERHKDWLAYQKRMAVKCVAEGGKVETLSYETNRNSRRRFETHYFQHCQK